MRLRISHRIYDSPELNAHLIGGTPGRNGTEAQYMEFGYCSLRDSKTDADFVLNELGELSKELSYIWLLFSPRRAFCTKWTWTELSNELSYIWLLFSPIFALILKRPF